jgi:hypothetical protein
VINATNLAGKDKPRRTIGNAAETIKLLASASPRLKARPKAHPRLADRRPWALRARARISPARDLPRRTGAWLFRRNDAEAGWRRWEITELHRGLSRLYRDTRFEALHQLYEAVSGYHLAKPSDEQP